MHQLGLRYSILHVLPILTPSQSAIHQMLLVSLKLQTWLSNTNQELSLLVRLGCQRNKCHDEMHDLIDCLLHLLYLLQSISDPTTSSETWKPFSTPSSPCSFPKLQFVTKPCWSYQSLNSSQIIFASSCAHKSSSCPSFCLNRLRTLALLLVFLPQKFS